MSLDRYALLKGTIIGHLRDADDDHYQILAKAGTATHRIASNVKSSAPNAPSIVLFYSTTAVPDELTKQLKGLGDGFKKLPSKPGGLALDYVRSGWIKTSKMVPVPPDQPGVDNDLKDKLEDAVVKAVAEHGSVIYAFGQQWGPEPTKKDKYFRFLPGSGIHDIHMNQGNDGKYKKDNGLFQDGGLIFQYPGDKWLAFLFAFQSQTFDTDEKGNPKGSPDPRKPPKKPKKGTKKGLKKKAGGKKKPK